LPDNSDYGLTGNAYFNDEGDELEVYSSYRTPTRNTAADNCCKNKNTSSKKSPASRHLVDEGRDRLSIPDRIRKAHEACELE
jgi:hypothetical protein